MNKNDHKMLNNYNKNENRLSKMFTACLEFALVDLTDRKSLLRFDRNNKSVKYS